MPDWASIRSSAQAGLKKKTLATSSSPLPQTQAEDAADVSVDLDALKEWLGAGAVPVSKELAALRALTCFKCDRNSSSTLCPDGERKSWMSWVTPKIAWVLKKYSALKNRMNLTTPYDAELGKCLACECELPLKVWVGLPHIVDNMGPKTSAAIAKVPHCWVNTERHGA